MASTISVDKIKATAGGAVTFTLPTVDGQAGQSLQTNASGVLSFGDVDPIVAKGGDIASASPCVIPDGNLYYDVTGTTGFAAFTVTAGRHFILQFDGALTMTHHSTNLDLPSEDDILTVAGDVAEFMATGTNTAQCINYTRADGTPVVSGTIANNAIDETKLKDALVADFTEVVVATGDSLVFGDATDSGNTKRDTVQGVLDLVHDATIGLQTIWVPANAMTPTDASGCEGIASVATSANKPDMIVLDFLVASDSFAQFQIAFPKSWNEGTITYQVYWSSTATDTDNVRWTLEGVSVPDNSTIDVAYGSAVYVDDPNQGAAEEMLVSPVSGALTIGSAAVDTVTFFRIGRDVSEGTAAEAARLLGVKLFFTTDAENDA